MKICYLTNRKCRTCKALTLHSKKRFLFLSELGMSLVLHPEQKEAKFFPCSWKRFISSSSDGLW